MKSKFTTKSVFAVLFSLIIALSALPVSASGAPPAPPSASPSPSPVPAKSSQPESMVYAAAFGRTRIRMNSKGEYRIDRKATNAEVGGTEYFGVKLFASAKAEAGERATVTIESDIYDFSKCAPQLLVPVDDVYYVMYLPEYTAEEHSISAVVSVQYLGVNAAEPVYMFVSGTKQSESGKASVTVERELKSQFDYGESVLIGNYIVNKQGGVLPVELALGLSGMSERDTVYIVSNSEGAEILRLVVQDGRLIGIGKKEGELVIGLEYSIKDKCYVSALTRKKLLDRKTVLDIFEELDVSFAKDPNEETWLDEQNTYRMRKGILIR